MVNELVQLMKYRQYKQYQEKRILKHWKGINLVNYNYNLLPM